MAKAAKPKRETSINPRSRAARRAASPSLDLDKSIKETPRASDATPILAPFRGAGIQKKSRKKQLTHAQRVRHEKGLQKAELVQDRTQAKVAESKSRYRRVQNRRALWEDVNSTSNEEVRKAIKPRARMDMLREGDDLKDNIQPFHGDTEIKVIDGVLVPAFATGQTLDVAVVPNAFASNTKKPGTFGLTPAPNAKAEENAEATPLIQPAEPLDEIT